MTKEDWDELARMISRINKTQREITEMRRAAGVKPGEPFLGLGSKESP